MRWTQALFSNYFKRYIERELHEGKLRRQWHPLTGWKEIKRKQFNYSEHRPWTDEFKTANHLGKRPKTVYVQPLKEWSVFKGDRSDKYSRGILLSAARPLHTQSQRNFHCTPPKMVDVPQGVLLGVGNPLLDITITTDTGFLAKYDLQANNAILASERQAAMFDDMMTNHKPLYMAGGATQNSIRVAQWLLGKKNATTFFGCVGEDDRADILEQKGREAGVNVQYMRSPLKPTGVCGAVITDDNRSLVADLGAADFFAHAYIESAPKWQLIEMAQAYYICGFVFPVCNQVIFDIGKHACDQNKTFAMNLSAPFLCKYFADKSIDIMPYIDVLFGNETEAAEFCKLRGIEATDITTMALETSRLPKANQKRERLVIFTQGTAPTIIARDDKVSELPILPVKKEDIRDTNGCGDAFVGGFLSQLVQGKSLEESLACGQYAARVVIKHWGCTFPPEPDFK